MKRERRKRERRKRERRKRENEEKERGDLKRKGRGRGKKNWKLEFSKLSFFFFYRRGVRWK